MSFSVDKVQPCHHPKACSKPIFDISVGVNAFDDAPNNIVGTGAITILRTDIEDIVQRVIMDFGIVNGRLEQVVESRVRQNDLPAAGLDYDGFVFGPRPFTVCTPVLLAVDLYDLVICIGKPIFRFVEFPFRDNDFDGVPAVGGGIVIIML